jgi:hypothetical protein
MQSSALLLPTADNATHAVHVLPVWAVQMQFIEVPHSAHVAPEKAGQLAHAAEPVVLLYEPAEHATHGPPSGPV